MQTKVDERMLEILRESLEQHIVLLEDLLQEHNGDLEQPVACIDCLSVEPCICDAPRWPIYHVLAKIKREITGP